MSPYVDRTKGTNCVCCIVLKCLLPCQCSRRRPHTDGPSLVHMQIRVITCSIWNFAWHRCFLERSDLSPPQIKENMIIKWKSMWNFREWAVDREADILHMFAKWINEGKTIVSVVLYVLLTLDLYLILVLKKICNYNT